MHFKKPLVPSQFNIFFDFVPYFTSRHIVLQMQFGVKYSTRHNGLLVCYKMSRQFDRCPTRGFLGRHKKYHIISSYCRYCKLWTSKRSGIFFILLIILFQSLFSLMVVIFTRYMMSLKNVYHQLNRSATKIGPLQFPKMGTSTTTVV